MKKIDSTELVRLARLSLAHARDERDDFFDEVDRLQEEREMKRKDLVKPRQERD